MTPRPNVDSELGIALIALHHIKKRNGKGKNGQEVASIILSSREHRNILFRSSSFLHPQSLRSPLFMHIPMMNISSLSLKCDKKFFTSQNESIHCLFPESAGSNIVQPLFKQRVKRQQRSAVAESKISPLRKHKRKRRIQHQNIPLESDGRADMNRNRAGNCRIYPQGNRYSLRRVFTRATLS